MTMSTTPSRDPQIQRDYMQSPTGQTATSSDGSFIRPQQADLEAAVSEGTRGQLLDQWCSGLRISHIAQSRAAAQCVVRGRILGTAVVVITAIVSTSIFATLQGDP